MVARYTNPPLTAARTLPLAAASVSKRRPTAVPANANNAVQNCSKMACFAEQPFCTKMAKSATCVQARAGKRSEYEEKEEVGVATVNSK